MQFDLNKALDVITDFRLQFNVPDQFLTNGLDYRTEEKNHREYAVMNQGSNLIFILSAFANKAIEVDKTFGAVTRSLVEAFFLNGLMAGAYLASSEEAREALQNATDAVIKDKKRRSN